MPKTLCVSALNIAIYAMGKQRWDKERQYLDQVRQQGAIFACGREASGPCPK